MKYLFIIIIITITLACCKKKSFVPDIPSGSNTIECTIDGKTFQTSGPKGGNNISCNDEVVMYTGGLGGAHLRAKKCGFGSLEFNFYETLQQKNYNIDNMNPKGNISFTNTQSGMLYYSYLYGGTGIITILKITNNYIYGTFEGKINAKDGTFITIKDGKFDVAL